MVIQLICTTFLKGMASWMHESFILLIDVNSALFGLVIQWPLSHLNFTDWKERFGVVVGPPQEKGLIKGLLSCWFPLRPYPALIFWGGMLGVGCFFQTCTCKKGPVCFVPMSYPSLSWWTNSWSHWKHWDDDMESWGEAWAQQSGETGARRQIHSNWRTKNTGLENIWFLVLRWLSLKHVMCFVETFQKWGAFQMSMWYLLFELVLDRRWTTI